ncbi:hypothetical protein HDV05_002558 [Chytridiales sp. JEL 0842]|nr:hypothetical protein HDV05_002558 [Chytridiales sp. JEL 0842]
MSDATPRQPSIRGGLPLRERPRSWALNEGDRISQRQLPLEQLEEDPQLDEISENDVLNQQHSTDAKRRSTVSARSLPHRNQSTGSSNPLPSLNPYQQRRSSTSQHSTEPAPILSKNSSRVSFERVDPRRYIDEEPANTVSSKPVRDEAISNTHQAQSRSGRRRSSSAQPADKSSTSLVRKLSNKDRLRRQMSASNHQDPANVSGGEIPENTTTAPGLIRKTSMNDKPHLTQKPSIERQRSSTSPASNSPVRPLSTASQKSNETSTSSKSSRIKAGTSFSRSESIKNDDEGSDFPSATKPDESSGNLGNTKSPQPRLRSNTHNSAASSTRRSQKPRTQSVTHTESFFTPSELDHNTSSSNMGSSTDLPPVVGRPRTKSAKPRPLSFAGGGVPILKNLVSVAVMDNDVLRHRSSMTFEQPEVGKVDHTDANVIANTMSAAKYEGVTPTAVAYYFNEHIGGMMKPNGANSSSPDMHIAGPSARNASMFSSRSPGDILSNNSSYNDMPDPESPRKIDALLSRERFKQASTTSAHIRQSNGQSIAESIPKSSKELSGTPTHRSKTKKSRSSRNSSKALSSIVSKLLPRENMDVNTDRDTMFNFWLGFTVLVPWLLNVYWIASRSAITCIFAWLSLIFLTVHVAAIGITFRAMAEHNWPFNEVPSGWVQTSTFIAIGCCLFVWISAAIVVIFTRRYWNNQQIFRRETTSSNQSDEHRVGDDKV